MPRRVLLGAAIAVAAILVVVLGAALLQDDEAPARPTATTQDPFAIRPRARCRRGARGRRA
jgi:hypothetical protein